MPTGELQTEAYVGPVRVDQDGVWQDIDTSLSDTGADLTPEATAADIAVSDGGDTALASVAKGDKSFGLGWQDKLPTPAVKDNTASYDLGDGQKLTVSALAQGFIENVVLDQQPDGPVSYRIPLDLDELKLSQAESGHLLLKDTSGKLVAEAPAPMMWDSTKNPVSGESDHHARVATTVQTAEDGKQSLVLTPAADFLATATYPVTVDPTSTLAVTTDTWVQTPDYPDSQKGSQELKSGTHDTGQDIARSYLHFNTAKFNGKHITSAVMSLYSYYSSTCTTTGTGTQAKRITSLLDTTTITWGTQPSTTTDSMATNTGHWGYDSSCPANWSSWTLTGMVQDWADGAANYGIQLRSADEKAPTTWRRFRSANYTTTGYAPKLVVTYNSYPATPSALTVSPGSTTSGVRTVTSVNPVLSTKVTDADAGASLTTQFNIEADPAYADTHYSYTKTAAAVASGKTATLTVPLTASLPDGKHLRVRARSNDGADYSTNWSAWSNFSVNTGAVKTPDVPSGLQTGATQTLTPLLTGVVSAAGQGNVTAQFVLSNSSGTVLGGTPLGTDTVESGNRAALMVPDVLLTNGSTYTWKMRACVQSTCSAYTGSQSFTVNVADDPSGSTPTTITVPAGALTASTVAVDGTAPGVISGTLKVGSDGAQHWRSYLKPDLSAIPAGARLDSVILHLTRSGCPTSCGVRRSRLPLSAVTGLPPAPVRTRP
ncbi:DNRLRE domain-containing protein [Actinacidiphila glaucinigra]|uniref:DNRLRE domain-containing protein n=1 Tax=Actinacidiphila glaucinigra TaxID=235986 RepID=UPI00386F4A54